MANVPWQKLSAAIAFPSAGNMSKANRFRLRLTGWRLTVTMAHFVLKLTSLRGLVLSEQSQGERGKYNPREAQPREMIASLWLST